ncbi:MAG TPA: beta-ketoacyl-ACP synthase III [Coxiellaceae bacterium]|nr:beta-ketoacyl-ACP synthase III [Coxiellaceae bacterium]
MSYSKIIGVGTYLPERTVSNDDLAKTVDTSDEWIVQRTGISRRHIAAEGETASSLAEHAARQALQEAQVQPEEIDLIIVATATADKFFPSTACLLQARLGITTCCIAFDVSAACSGFVYALSIADQFIRSGAVKNALIVGTEVLSRITDWTDRRTCVLFGDGAGAFVLTASEKPGILSSTLHADGRQSEILYINNTRAYPSPDANIQMKGKELFKFAINAAAALIRETLEINKITMDDIDWLVPHQANERITEALAKNLNFPIEKTISSIKEQANTSAASIPLAFASGVNSGKIKRGQKVMLVGFGGGMTWGSILMVY